MGLLNIGSLILGVVAWSLPLANFVQYKRHSTRAWDWVTASIISLSACAISLCFQLVYNNHLIKISDWTALLDTADTLVVLSATLLIVTLILNGITLIIHRKMPPKKG